MKRNRVPAILLAALLILEPASAAMATEVVPETTAVAMEETVLQTGETQQQSEETEPAAEEQTGLPEDIPPEIVERTRGILFSTPAPLLPPVTGRAEVSLFRRTAENTDSNLILKKTAVDNQDGTFTLRLESYATGTASVVTQVPIPSDVVLVLDESGSMNDCIDCGHEMNVPCDTFEEGCLHRVFRSELDTGKRYRTYYRNSAAEERIVGYCSGCGKWYSNGPYSKCSGHGSLGYWVAFESESDTHSFDNKVYRTQFYAVCGHNTQRMDALKGAVTEFLNRLYADSIGPDKEPGTMDDVDNHVAIVGYDNDSPARIYTPAEGSDGYIYADSLDAAEGALLNMAENRDAVYAGLDGIRVRAATATHRGMEAAERILRANPVPSGQKRNRVVIVFTDGSPGSGYVNDKAWADSAISYANTIKQELGATVYTVGLFWGADASNPGNLPDYDVTANGVNNPQFFRNGNRFLHLVSSNYPNALSLDSVGNAAVSGSDGGYYLSTDDESGLYSIFGKLSGVVTPGSTTVTLDENSAVKDLITEVFEIDGNTAVSAWTESFRGEDRWEKDLSSVSTPNGGTLTVSVVDRVVTVTGFDFAEHYVASDENPEEGLQFRGKKLVIQVVIRPIAGFLGGDDIDTNLHNSGIFAGPGDTEPVKRFEIPSVDVAVRQIQPNTTQRDIYLSQTAILPELLNPGEYFLDGGPHQADRIKNKYASIIYTLTDPAGKVWKCTIPAGDAPENALWEVPEGMDQNPLLKEDTVYSIQCEVVSANNGENRSKSDASAQILVYLPEVTFRDSGINLGQIPDYGENFCSVRWFHGERDADPEVLGRAPKLRFAYSPEASAFRKDTAVAVRATAVQEEALRVPADQDITNAVTFYREGCARMNCDNPRTSVVDGKDPERINFVVHMNTFHLGIEKQGAEPDLDPGCTFLFRITGPKGFSMDVAVPGNGRVWIRNLPVGTYYITELSDWSWRYEPEIRTKSVDKTLVTEGIAQVTFVNERRDDKWLDGETRGENRFRDPSEGGEEAAG